MAPKKSLLEQMKANPKGDWTISDVKTLCKQVGLTLHHARRDSHYHVSSNLLTGGLQTVPYRRPIKPVYIRCLVDVAEEHLRRQAERKRKGESDGVPDRSRSPD